jgi:UDP-N-acetylglucosamine:LPS N-acetylglucosamine transferase
MNIAIVSSQGGHSGQAGIIFTKEVLRGHNSVFITESPEKRGKKDKQFQKMFPTYYFPKDVLQFNPLIYLKRTLELRTIFKKEKIECIVTNGAQLSIPAVLAAKMEGIYIIFIDTFIRVKTPNWSARFCYFFSDRFLVQHESMKKKYGKKSEYRGSVL